MVQSVPESWPRSARIQR